MIRLQTDETLQDEAQNQVSEDESQDIDLASFSKSVFDSLIERDIAPLPLNYQAYFEQMLNSTSINFQKQIHNLMQTDLSNDDRNILFEKNIHLAFANTREILKCISGIYKSLVLMDSLEKKWLTSLRANNVNSQDFLSDTKSLQTTIESQLNQLKTLYQKCNAILETINTNTMYDAKFDTYNKRYFIKLVQSEQNLIQKFSHTSSLLMLTLPNSVISSINGDQAKGLVIMKTIAKLLLKTSRRSDIIGYIGNGIFSMLLKNSDVFSATKASERLIELIKSAQVMLGKEKIDLDLHIGIAKMSAERSAEDALNYAIGALRLAQKNNLSYVVCKNDEEKA